MAKTIKITQKKSAIGYHKKQKATIEALGLRKLGHSVTHKATPALLGMVKAVQHLVETETT
ncbi:MAG: 50S ribosomal protein L30 [Bacteroidota bacterium]